jgi:hypothetical protein
MDDAVHQSLALLFSELVDGPAAKDAYMLNPGDQGLLRSLDRLSASDASARTASEGASIAAHVDHLCYGLELLIRWSEGEPNPWATADWAASWRRTTVNDAEWAALRTRLREGARRWHTALQQPHEMGDVERNGVIGSVAHLAYHLGAIRQINRATQGPKAS